jgi:sulfite dehydrogenase (quinone) subunit SoeC
MNPALSVIFFTTASGGGYFLLALMGGLGALGLLPSAPGFGLAGFLVGLGMVTAGLLSSTFHLGHPERAWRALSQWRSSWLSREGVLAVIAYVPVGALAIGWVFLGRIWPVLGLAAAICCIATVAATAMIYASLKPIQRWHNDWVLPNYLLLGLASGGLWLLLLIRIFRAEAPVVAPIALIALAGAALGKAGYWRFIDRSRSVATAESATGLGALGGVRLLAAPHTEENYLLKEMGYRIARKHAAKLRRIALIAGFAAPLLLVALGLVLSGAAGTLLIALAVLANALGTVTERWLFFAEAKHTVTLYYGAAQA